MKPLFFVFLLFIIVSCGKINPEGTIELQKKPVSEFVNMDLEGKFRVFYASSTSDYVEVETYPNLIDNLKIKVKDKTLFISEKRGVKGVDFYTVTIYSKYNPQQISLSDSVEFNVSSEINTDNFRLNLKNSGKFIGAIRSRKAEVKMEQTSLANFRGFTKDAVIQLKDTANLLAPFWKIDHVQLDASGGTFAEFFVKDSLKGKVENTSKLIYHGDPVRAFSIGKQTTVENQNEEQ